MVELRFEQIQRLSQKLVISPQMQQAMHLLQLPLMEMSMLIRQEMNTNPVLEDIQKEEEVTESEAEREEQQKNDEDDARKDTAELEFKEEFDRLAQLDDEWREYFRQSGAFRKYSQEDEERRRFFEASISRPETLHEHLTRQLQLTVNSERDVALGEFIIGNIDDNGYLQASAEELVTLSSRSQADVEKMILLLQNFHPVGVCARTIQECLLTQLRRLGKGDTLVTKIVEQHLEDLGKKRYPYIARSLETTVQQVQRASEAIATLEPKPGRMFSHETAHYIVPDVIIHKLDDDYVVILNDDRIPNLHISKAYKDLIKSKDVDQSTKSYIREKVKSGMWLLKNIQQRQQTIYNISKEIVARQKAFLDNGISCLVPTTMQEVADTIGIHESTVSRATANKYMQTPQGIYQMKFFFSTAIPTFNGDSVSATNLKNKIAELIKNEDSKRPLSDQKIIEYLAQEGIKLARRTVAKYRKELQILSSNLRRAY